MKKHSRLGLAVWTPVFAVAQPQIVAGIVALPWAKSASGRTRAVLAADDSTWTMVYDFDGKPAWLWPHGRIPPSKLSASADGSHHGVGIHFGFDLTGALAGRHGQASRQSSPPSGN